MKSVLIIEDDPQMRLFLETLLAKNGFAVSVAADGLTGLRSFRSAPADLVITDILMPEKEGLETIVELRRDFPEVRIIAISGGSRLTHVNFLKIAQKMGAARVLAKPFSRQDLLDAIHEVLNASSVPPPVS